MLANKKCHNIGVLVEIVRCLVLFVGHFAVDSVLNGEEICQRPRI